MRYCGILALPCAVLRYSYPPPPLLRPLLDVNKASLGLSSKLLQACANEISPSLCRLFNLSLELGTFPEKWKHANLVPIHKCEFKTMHSNYRSISLLDVLSKILERQVYNEILRMHVGNAIRSNAFVTWLP